jgi:XTP/dITP diphosphohydrolase
VELWIATSNQGKLNEFKMLFNRQSLQIRSQNELPVFSPRPENGDSFLANARIKTKALKSVQNKHWVLGEDSGLLVSGLNNLPGIHSARYAGPNASDAENNAKLLKMMAIRQIADRKAQFVSQIVLFSPEGEEFLFEGILEGTIATNSRGQTGFGYDNVFIPSGETLTMAELGLARKNQISHRARAVQTLIESLSARWTDSANSSL